MGVCFRGRAFMQFHMTKEEVDGSPDRIESLRHAVQTSRPGVCTERALIWTNYFKNKEHRKKDIHVQMGEALRDVLLKKRATIYPDELIVGNFSSKRVFHKKDEPPRDFQSGEVAAIEDHSFLAISFFRL
jgi:hypothetical protein